MATGAQPYGSQELGVDIADIASAPESSGIRRRRVRLTVESNENTENKIIADATASKRSTLIIILITAVFVCSAVGVFLFIWLDTSAHDSGSAYSSLKKVSHRAIISIPEVFDDDDVWHVPDIIANGGRVLITMTGGGGGGCDGEPAVPGGGGNSGVSTVLYPALLDKKDVCMITIGTGGVANNEGQPTSLLCVNSKTNKKSVDLEVLGGRSGCVFFNGTQMRRGPSDYPYTSERFGGRPDTGFLAESHPYGGQPGAGAGGGAGSVFGTGGDTGADGGGMGDEADGKGAGGGGGGSGFGKGGMGRKGRVKIVYTSKIKN